MRHLLIVAAVCVVAAFVSGSQGQDRPADRYIPEKTVVAILPVVNISGEKDAGQKVKQAENAQRELAKRFAERGFAISDSRAVSAAISDLKIDLNDEEQHKRANMLAVGKAVNADLVMFVAITDVSQRTSMNIFSTTKEGKAKLKGWLLDVKREEAIFSARVCEGKSTGGAFGNLEKGSERIVLAAANGVRDLLKEFFEAYPAGKK